MRPSQLPINHHNRMEYTNIQCRQLQIPATNCVLKTDLVLIIDLCKPLVNHDSMVPRGLRGPIFSRKNIDSRKVEIVAMFFHRRVSIHNARTHTIIFSNLSCPIPTQTILHMVQHVSD